MQKKALVVHSGGMDSSLCLALAVREFGAANVTVSFNYDQRHHDEINRAQRICAAWKVDHIVLSLVRKRYESCLHRRVSPRREKRSSVVATRASFLTSFSVFFYSCESASYLLLLSHLFRRSDLSAIQRSCARASFSLKVGLSLRTAKICSANILPAFESEG